MAVDVTVMGAGIFGLSCAWECVLRGASVRVVDPNGPGAGSSGGVLGALAPHTPERWENKKEFQLQSLLSAGKFWSDVAAASGQNPGYARTGRILPIMDERTLELAHTRTLDAKQLWRGHAEWRVIPNVQYWSIKSPTGQFVFDTLTAKIHPRHAISALANALGKRGCKIVEKAAPEGKIIWATGVDGLNDLSQDLGREVGNGQKGQALLIDFAAPLAAQIFVDGVHIVPHIDGTTGIGSTSERYFDCPRSTDGKVDALLDKAVEWVPELAGARVIDRWAGVRPRAMSRAPLLGAWPGRSGHFVANGGFKIGFGMAPGVGKTMAKLVLDGEDTIPDEFRLVE